MIIKILADHKFLLGSGFSEDGTAKSSPFLNCEKCLNNVAFEKFDLNVQKIGDVKETNTLFNSNIINAVNFKVNNTSKFVCNNNELNAYRCIIKQEEILKTFIFSDEAVAMLKRSPLEFKECFGQFFVARVYKGACVSVNYELGQETVDQLLDTSGSVDLSKIINFITPTLGKVSNLTDITKNLTFFKNCVRGKKNDKCNTKLMGVKTNGALNSFEKCVEVIENLEKYCQDSPEEIYYELHKYEDYIDYLRILKSINRWDLFLIRFEELSPLIRNENIKLYEDIIVGKGTNDYSQCVKIEILLNELKYKSDKLSYSVENVTDAILNSKDHALFKEKYNVEIIEKVVDQLIISGSINKLLSFVNTLGCELHKLLYFVQIFCTIRKLNYPQNVLNTACKEFKKQVVAGQICEFIKQSVVCHLPTSFYKLFSNKYCAIKSSKYSKHITTSGEIENKRVYVNTDEIFEWEFVCIEDKFAIKSRTTNEFISFNSDINKDAESKLFLSKQVNKLCLWTIVNHEDSVRFTIVVNNKLYTMIIFHKFLDGYRLVAREKCIFDETLFLIECE